MKLRCNEVQNWGGEEARFGLSSLAFVARRGWGMRSLLAVFAVTLVVLYYLNKLATKIASKVSPIILSLRLQTSPSRVLAGPGQLLALCSGTSQA